MKIIYKLKGEISEKLMQDLRKVLAERLEIQINDVIIICDERFDCSDILIINK